jgi:hypothetical protein
VYLGCCAAAWVLARRAGGEGLTEGPRLGMVAPLAAIAGLLWVLSHSTRPEFLAVGAVLVMGSGIYWLGRRFRRGTFP